MSEPVTQSDPLPVWARNAVPGPVPAGLARVQIQVFQPEAYVFRKKLPSWRPVDVLREKMLPPLPHCFEERVLMALHLPADEDLEDRVVTIRGALARRNKNPERVQPEDWHLLNAVALGPFVAAPGVLLATDLSQGHSEAVQLRVASSAAHGLGTHPSTRLVLRALTQLKPEGRVLDIGAGTGVLSLAALQLGFQSAHCIEIAQAACRDLQRLARVNRLARKVTVRKADAARLEEWPEAETLLANISPVVLSQVLPRVLSRPALRQCLLAGFQTGHEAGLRATVLRARPQARIRLSGLGLWRCLSAHW